MCVCGVVFRKDPHFSNENMSEIRRVALTPLETHPKNDPAPKKYPKTVRITLKLPESNEDTCPEYNYKDELAAAKKRGKSNKDGKTVENGFDPFGEDDSDVQRIAREMEAKYGTGMSCGPKKRSKNKKDEYADIGMGYDENDSFIDNTDGYDEIIPQNVTTLHGGFYINCGALEFKARDERNAPDSSSTSETSSSDSEQSNNEEEENHEQKPKEKKKRALDSSDESESDPTKKPAEKKQKIISAKNSIQHAIQKKLFSQEKIKVKKRKFPDKKIKELIKERRVDLNMSVPTELDTTTDENLEKDPLKENKKPMSITSVTDAIESVLKQVVVEESYDNNQNKQSVNVNNVAETNNSSKIGVDVLAENDSSQDRNTEKPELVKLPENLPTDILDIINKLKQAAIDYKGEVRTRFFNDEVNSNLLSLEKKCRILGKSSRLIVYEHLSFYINIKKESLIRRAKSLTLKSEESNVRHMKRKFKEALEKEMPALVANFEQESQKVLQMRFSKDGSGEKNDSLRIPKRRYEWSDQTRRYLKDIVVSKKKCLVLEGKQKHKLEELIVQFMVEELIPLWPEGWMTINPLKKAYNTMTESNSSKLTTDSMIKLGNGIPETAPNTKHSNLTITPVLTKSIPKTELSNSVTVTKIETKPVETKTEKTVVEKTKEIFKPYSDKPTSKESKPAWPSELFITPSAEQPKDYSKYRHNDGSAKSSRKEEKMVISSKCDNFNAEGVKHPWLPEILPKHQNFNNEPPKQHQKQPKQQHNEASTSSKPCTVVSSDFKHISDLLKLSPEPKQQQQQHKDSGVIVVNSYQKEVKLNNDNNEVKQHTAGYNYNEVRSKKKQEEARGVRFKDVYAESSLPGTSNFYSKYQDFTSNTNFMQSATSTPKMSKSEGDDIQKVMENLRALQKLSCSPVKNDPTQGSPVSVIAYNNAFVTPAGKHSPNKNQEFVYQEDFQKQFINSLQQMAAAAPTTSSSTNSKSNYKSS